VARLVWADLLDAPEASPLGHIDAELLGYLTSCRLVWVLRAFHEPARKRPASVSVGVADEQHLILVLEDAAHATHARADHEAVCPQQHRRSAVKVSSPGAQAWTVTEGTLPNPANRWPLFR
jgi:hypothetical protein